METFDFDVVGQQTGLQDKSTNVLSAISESWRRCTQFGLSKSGRPVEAVVSQADLTRILSESEHIRNLVQPELELLYNQIAGTNFMVAYANHSGVVLDALQDHDFQAGEGGKTVIPGSIWMEEHRGTNALGLALHTKRAAIVSGSDHYFRKLGDLSCFAAPIFDHDENVIGVIDATSNAKARSEHTLALVKLASQNVSNRLLLDQFSDSLILMFHARLEYLPTTSVALMAVDEFGFIEGANMMAKRMLSGLNLSRRQHFSEIFNVNFSSIVDELRSHDIIQIEDKMRSTVFMKAHPIATPRIVQVSNMPQTASPKNAETLKSEKTLIFDDTVLASSIKKAIAALHLDLPVLIEGQSGSGKTEAAKFIARSAFPNTPVTVIDGSLLSQQNYEQYLFGDEGRLGFFDDALAKTNIGKFGMARGGTVIIENMREIDAEIIPFIQHAIAYEETSKREQKRAVILGWIFTQSAAHTEKEAAETEGQTETMSNVHFLSLPALSHRDDFSKLAHTILAELSPKHQLSQLALRTLSEAHWPDNLSQLRKTLQKILSDTESYVIRHEAMDALSGASKNKHEPCPQCSSSPVRTESCILIKRTWEETGGNVSQVSRRLGISRNTVYKHVS